MMLRKLSWLGALGVLLLPAVLGFCATPTISVDDIRPGMRGVGKTVFSGTEIEEFGVEIIDVIRNYYPQQDIVLARLVGPNVEKTGVAAGMSGSPVYIDGKLLGAVAYRFGVFTKEALAGIMPIEQMLPVVKRQERRSALWGQAAVPMQPFLNTALGVTENDPFLNVLGGSVSGEGASLQPWPHLLVMSGFSQPVLQWAKPLLANLGFQVAQGGSGSASEAGALADSSLVPGAGVALVLVDGDMSLDVVGTITWRDGNRILAFGHPVFDTGPVLFPLGTVKIATTIASPLGSNKFPVLTGLAGTFYQDRLSGSYGEIGKLPPLTPVTVTCRGADLEPKEFHFRAALGPSLRVMMPFYLRVVLINAIESARMSGGDYSLRLRGVLKVNGSYTVHFDDFYARQEVAGFMSPMDDALRATMSVASSLASLMLNPFRPVRVDSLGLSVEILPRSRRAVLLRVWHDRGSVQPGDSVTFVATLLTLEGKKVQQVFRYRVPENLTPGSRLSVTIGGAKELTRSDMRNFPFRFRPQSFDQLVRILNTQRRNDRLYLQVRVNEVGAEMGGQELPALPPSLIGILNARRDAGGVSSVRSRVLVDRFVDLGYEVSGSRTISLKVTDGENEK
ncbi:MAG: hypothetical protein GXO73_13540 [Calditrichaeota bacterium]|nr:hypothetical protein [Calditrichota bacterium]